MFLTKSISQYLNSEVSYKKFKLGKTLSQEITNLDLVSDPEQRLIACQIEEHQSVITYDATNTISKLSCTCHNTDPDDCVHIVTSLYLLLNTSDSIIQKNIAKFEKVEEPNLEIKKGVLNKYRELPQIKGQNSSRIWNKLFVNRNNRFQTNFEINLILLNQSSELEVEVKSTVWAFDNKRDGEVVKVNLKKENNHFHIKCNECEEESVMLCKHQHAVLLDNSIHRLLSNDRELDYKVVSNHFMDVAEVSQKLFDIAYVIQLDGPNYYAVELENALISTQEILTTQKQLSQNITDKNQLQHLLEKKTLQNDVKWSNAYLWNHNFDGNPLPNIFMLKGKALKSKNKLGSKISLTDKVENFSTEQLDFYNQLMEVYDLCENGNLHTQEFLLFLQSNFANLENNIHYLSTKYIDEYHAPKKNELNQIYFREEQVRIKLKIEEDDGYFLLHTQLFLGNKEIKYNDNWSLWPIFAYDAQKNHVYLYNHSHVYYLARFWTGNTILIKDKDRIHLLNLFHKIEKNINVIYPDNFKNLTHELNGGDKHIYMSEAGDYIIFTPKINHDGQLYDVLETDQFLYEEIDGEEKVVVVNSDTKDSFIKYIKELSVYFENSYNETGQFYLSVADFVRDAWFLNFYESCKEQDVEIFGQEKLDNFRFNKNKAKVSTSIASGIDWFEVDVDLSFGGEKVAYKTWIEAIKNNENFVKLDDGTMGLLPDEWFNKIRSLFKISDNDKDGLKINHFKYCIIEELFDEVSEDESYADLRSKFESIKDANLNQAFDVPESIKGELRPYQLDGFQWLCTLDQIGFGGCLADDMGLGKTIQMISLLAYQKELNNGSSLVIVPRSLLFNWIAEMDKFCPALNYYLHHGPKRGKIKDISIHDVVLTTYDTASSDVEYLRETTFNYIILDESQAIKNPNSKRYKAMRVLQSRNKFVMTGTPIENNTFDLYAQFSFINPGIFGSQAHFKDRFSTPIDKEGDADTSQQLKKIIHPFLLRRTKELVAKDLPERSENIIYCEMGAQQRKMYEDLKNRIAQDIKASIDDKGLAKSKFKILDGLLRLRQICNSPLLLNKTLSPSQSESVKIKTLVDILDGELKDHNALVFSQFTSMLALIREELDNRKIRYAYLDGQTRDRKSAVEEFQENDDVKIFLLSLKAGNTGLNLVKADYVYIVDPWWNPAVEAQAIDRTHRIGQDKNIFAYRMICKDSIEEKIVELQNKKKKIAKDIIVTDENIFKSLEKNDLLGLFE